MDYAKRDDLVVPFGTSIKRLYLRSKRDPRVIHSIPIRSVSRYDVLGCVFEKDHDAYRQVEYKEFIDMFTEGHYSDVPKVASFASIASDTLFSYIDRWYECRGKYGLSPSELIGIFLDCFGVGDNVINSLKSSADWHVDTRRKIECKHKGRITEWTKQSILAKKEVEKAERKIRSGKMSDDFRPVHAAREAKKAYIESGRKPEILNSIPANVIGRFDVWMCIFEDEPEAWRILQEKELVNLFHESASDRCSPDDAVYNRMLARLILANISNTMNVEIGIGLSRSIEIASSCGGKDFMKAFLQEAKKYVEIRKECVKGYVEGKKEWVQEAERIVSAIEDEIDKHQE